MHWIKKGIVVRPGPQSAYATTAAMLPTAFELNDQVLRVFYSARDEELKARVCYVDVARTDVTTVLRHSGPVLDAGPLGAFDDAGVTAGSVIRIDGRLYLYYAGWTRGVSVPFYDYVGLAVSDDGGERFHRVSPAPVLERNEHDPYLTGPPCVFYENGRFRMWYASGSGWKIVHGAPRHFYNIRYAESSDGIHWLRDGHVCIDYANEQEYALARPWVVKDDSVYRMWFSHRGASYRIGYAESKEGLIWERRDEAAGIDVSESGWDSEMIEYANVVDVGGRRIMFYNGNGYGRSGFGYAELAD